MTASVVGVRQWWLRFTDIPIGPNDHVGRWTRIRQTKRWRTKGKLLALEQSIQPCARVRLSLVFHRRNLGVSDTDNDIARMKPVIDGIVDAGVVPDDKPRYVTWGTITETRGKRGVDVLIEEISGSEQ